MITNDALDSFQNVFREKYQTSDLTNTIIVFLEKGKTRLIVGHISYSRGFQVAFVERICISMYPLFPQILCRFASLGFFDTEILNSCIYSKEPFLLYISR